ncbi:MAG: UbiA family prenyltransferase [Bauldia sp.]|uniref:UbiA family prenyltransferase n=1 Tax=Bauldia sp. TaxID=2575872 RepID=UPI001D2E99BD|nr:UbiA family prenyltransferase [Bauldia sp.]MCB1495972.1 UbiA family prenyltransferase [Bauldia sp.]
MHEAESRNSELSPLRRRARGAVFVIHLFPAVMNAAAGFVFYLIAARAWEIWPALLLALSIFLVSAAVGGMNDFLDVELDRTSRPEKPLVRGDLAPRTAFVISAVAAVAGVVLSALFGQPVMLVALLVLAVGLAYDLWLKDTLFSWAPYGVGIPALPVWGFLAAGSFTPVLLVSFPLGVLIALALNLANTIPDIEGDTAFGIKGLAHQLGVDRSLAVTWICFAVTIVLLALTPVYLGNDPKLLFPGIAIGAVLLAATIIDRLISHSAAALRRGWYISAVLAGILGVAWVVSLPAN